jgi:phenylacetate-CoA ligase
MNRLLGRIAYAAAVSALGEQRVFRYLREARRVHRMSADELAARQRSALRDILRWASRNNDYYGPLLGTVADDVDPLRVLPDLPLLDKRTLQERGQQLRSAGFHGRTVQKSTGGSTGAPIRIIKDADGVAREMATTWAALETYGIRLGDRSARFWGTPLTSKRRLRFRLTDLAMNRIRLSAFDLDDADLRAYWRRCLAFRPVWLYGYASLIHLFAEWIERNGEDGMRLRLRAVVPTSEPLNDRQRTDIERVFGAPVYNEYGCGEVGAMAYACARGRLHIMTENVLVECLDEEQRPVHAGEIGELVVTDLTNRAMPLLRYRLGDRAVMGSGCTCGRGFPVIEQVMGRIHDVVYTPAGRRWHGEKLDYLMSQLYGEHGGFRQYQVVQHTAHDLLIRLVADEAIPSALERRIVEYVSEQLDGMRAQVVRVDSIERAPSGKIRVVRNDWLPHGVQPHS